MLNRLLAYPLYTLLGTVLLNTEGSMYDTGDDLIDWDSEDVYEADHHWVKLFINDKEV